MTSTDQTIDAVLVDRAPRSAPRRITRRGDERRRAAIFHVIFLAVPLATLAACFVLHLDDQGRVAAPFDFVFPGVCTWRIAYGLDCPGCGLTRSFVSLGHGRLADAWSYNPAGLLLFVAMVYQIPYRSAQLVRLARGLESWRHVGTIAFCWTLVAATIGQWIWKLAAS